MVFADTYYVFREESGAVHRSVRNLLWADYERGGSGCEKRQGGRTARAIGGAGEFAEQEQGRGHFDSRHFHAGYGFDVDFRMAAKGPPRNWRGRGGLLQLQAELKKKNQ